MRQPRLLPLRSIEGERGIGGGERGEESGKEREWEGERLREIDFWGEDWAAVGHIKGRNRERLRNLGKRRERTCKKVSEFFLIVPLYIYVWGFY